MATRGAVNRDLGQYNLQGVLHSETAATDGVPVLRLGGTMILRRAFVAGVTAGADDLVVGYALGALPFRFRVLNMWAFISTLAAGSTIGACTQLNGLGVVLGTVETGTAGYRPQTAASTTTGEAIPAATNGLFFHRYVDDRIVGEVFLLIQRTGT